MNTTKSSLLSVLQQENYQSHNWKTVKQNVPGEPDERITYCDDCGIEDRGDPLEFDNLEYPNCGEVGDNL